jgi:hypothetical protein
MTESNVNFFAKTSAGADLRPRREFVNRTTGECFRWCPDLPQRMTVYRPSAIALRVLVRHEAAGRLLLNGAEIALDLVSDDAESLGEWLIRRYVDRRAKSNAGGLFSAARYYGRRVRGPHVRSVIYFDRRSKTSGQPCVHIERRFRGRRTLRRMGIDSVSDLMRFDHHAFWMSRLSLFDVDCLALGRAVNRAGRSKRNLARHRLTGALLLRRHDGFVCDLVDEFRHLKPERWLRRIDAAPLLRWPETPVRQLHLAPTEQNRIHLPPLLKG